ncbi:unnamed protein product [Protopolystoma xenopodis]|uniref:Uncharacterized protein n=1 Tax=Protopolystoma xenopodis TaxID=117903 RepID=A0A3S5FH50_9PLAT|nr:unnamed protein product [Protopolystoma xenopodis]
MSVSVSPDPSACMPPSGRRRSLKMYFPRQCIMGNAGLNDQHLGAVPILTSSRCQLTSWDQSCGEPGTGCNLAKCTQNRTPSFDRQHVCLHRLAGASAEVPPLVGTEWKRSGLQESA